MAEAPDIVIIGSGIGGATIASGLAGSGARVAILERGDHLRTIPRRATRARSSSGQLPAEGAVA